MSAARQLVVQYLYVHGSDEHFSYPSARSQARPARLASRYLECALVQAASLRLRGVDCDLAMVTNLTDRGAVGARGERLLAGLESLGVEMLFADYEHRPQAEQALFASSRYVFDAMLAACDASSPETRLWLMDVDCVWLDAPRLFAAVASKPGIGCIHIGYSRDWKVLDVTPRELGELAQRLGAADDSLAWVGGELLTGTAREMRELLAACEAVERELLASGEGLLATEERLLSLAEALGRVRFYDLSAEVQRVWTGPRHHAPTPADLESLCVLHLPSEKGLGFRRAARAITSGHGERLVRDLEVPARALRRFNVAGAGRARRLRDDSWLAAQRVREMVLARVP